MFQKMIESAFHSGAELIVHIRGQENAFRGTVSEFDGEFFTLFHQGCCHGALWAFRLSDVLTCALLVPMPNSTCSDRENEDEDYLTGESVDA